MDLIMKVEKNQVYYSQWQHNRHFCLEAKNQTPETADNLVAQLTPWVERFWTRSGPWKKFWDPVYFRWYCFGQTLIEVLGRTEQLFKVEIALNSIMACGGDKIWPLFCRVGPLATQMYQLMIAAGFLRGEHPKYRWGSAAACDPGYIMITIFDQGVPGDDVEPRNSQAENEEEFTKDELIA